MKIKRLQTLAAASLLCVITSVAIAQQAEPEAAVSLTIDFGDGMQKVFPQIAWQELIDGEQPTTVGTVLAFAESHPRGIKLTTRGKGETRFLEAIDQLKNEGGGGRNWMFDVNGEMAKSSFATTVVEPGAVILWEFRKFQ